MHHRRYEISIHPVWLPGLLLVLLGGFLFVRQMFALGFWVWPTVLTAAGGAYLFAHYRHGRLGDLTGACLLLAWAAYAWIDSYIPLPFSLWFAFLGLGFFAVYYLGTKPLQWPLLPGGLLLALSTFFWVVGVTFSLARYLIPLLLIALGIAHVMGRNRY